MNLSKLRQRYRYRKLLKLFVNTRFKFILKPNSVYTDPVFLEFGNKLHVAVYLHHSMIQVYVHSTNAIPYVVAYAVAELAKLGRLDVRGSFTAELASGSAKPLSIVRSTNPNDKGTN